MNLSERLPEPPDGTVLTVIDTTDTPLAIWRRDEEGEGDRRWFGAGSPVWEYPETWSQVLEDVVAVHAVDPIPLAEER